MILDRNEAFVQWILDGLKEMRVKMVRLFPILDAKSDTPRRL
jgi:hypothetical protein